MKKRDEGAAECAAHGSRLFLFKGKFPGGFQTRDKGVLVKCILPKKIKIVRLAIRQH